MVLFWGLHILRFDIIVRSMLSDREKQFIAEYCDANREPGIRKTNDSVARLQKLPLSGFVLLLTDPSYLIERIYS